MTRLESDRCQDRLVFYLNLFEKFSWVFVQNVNKVHFNKKNLKISCRIVFFMHTV